MKLFKVKLITYSVVVADDEDAALELATNHGGDMTIDIDPSAISIDGEITKAEALPRHWTVEDYAWGFDDDMNIGEILDEIPAPDTKTIDMFAGSAA